MDGCARAYALPKANGRAVSQFHSDYMSAKCPSLPRTRGSLTGKRHGEHASEGSGDTAAKPGYAGCEHAAHPGGHHRVEVDSEKIAKDVTYEPPLVIAFGVDKHSVGSRTMTMGRTRIPPKGRNQAHYHSCEASFFIRKGMLKLYIGEEHSEYIVTENQFVFVPPGMIHGLENLSDTETAELIFTYGNCPSKDDAGTVFVEESWVAGSR